MSCRVTLLDEVSTDIAVPAPNVDLVQLCSGFEAPLECPEVIVGDWSWIVGSTFARVTVIDLSIASKGWSRHRATDEFGTSPGPWTDWHETITWPYDAYHVNMVLYESNGWVEYGWYDMQVRFEPEGLEGWQEIWPLCGGWWHFQTVKKDFPPPDPPFPEDPGPPLV